MTQRTSRVALRIFCANRLRSATCGLVSAALLSIFAASPAIAAPDLKGGSGLLRYTELEPNVEFWRNVFGKYTRRQIVFHDPYRLDVIWGVSDIGDIIDSARSDSQKSRAIDDHIKAETRRLRGQILAVASGKATTSEQRRIASALKAAGSKIPSAKTAADRIRAQRGLGDQLCESVNRARPLLPAMREALSRHGVPIELAFLPLVESGYRIGAHSHAGAVGMWQFTRGTGRSFLHIDHVVDERRDPLLASEAAAKFLRENYERLGTWPLAITAYNHGANGMAYAVRKLNTKNLATIVAKHRSRYFGFASRNFYSEFLAAHDVMVDALESCPIEGGYVDRAQVSVDAYVPLKELAKAAGMSQEALMALNPALMPDVGRGRLRVPKGYRLAVPSGSVAKFQSGYKKIPSSARYSSQASYYARHRVRRGETLSEIAKSYRTTVATLQRHNSIRDPRRLRSGVTLKVPVAGAAGAYAAPARAKAHTVARGQTLSLIAKRHGVSVGSLQRHNGLRNANLLRPGQVLRIPDSSAPRYKTHRVARGQTLSHIAKLYRTTVRALQNHNGIDDPRSLRQGQVIKIPM